MKKLLRMGAGALLAAALAWPSVYDWLARALVSPVEQLVRSAYCGAPPHAVVALLGHCTPCWAGAAALAIASVTLLHFSESPQERPGRA